MPCPRITLEPNQDGSAGQLDRHADERLVCCNPGSIRHHNPARRSPHSSCLLVQLGKPRTTSWARFQAHSENGDCITSRRLARNHGQLWNLS